MRIIFGLREISSTFRGLLATSSRVHFHAN